MGRNESMDCFLLAEADVWNKDLMLLALHIGQIALFRERAPDHDSMGNGDFVRLKPLPFWYRDERVCDSAYSGPRAKVFDT